MVTMRDAVRDVATDILSSIPPPELAALCARVPEVRQLHDRIDAPDFPTRQESADARYFLATGGRTFEQSQLFKGIS